MPEGPSIVILREAAAGFAGRKILRVSGNSKQDIDRMRNRKVLAVLRKHYQVHTKTICPRDGTRLSYRKHLGVAQRRAFWCGTCQRLYDGD